MNTNPGGQNARFKGSKVCAIRTIREGEEIFASYGGCFKFHKEDIDKETSSWGMFKQEAATVSL